MSSEARREGLVDRIAQGLRDPRGSTERIIAEEPSEAVLLSILMVAGLLRFVGAGFGIVAAGPAEGPDPAEAFRAALGEAAVGAFLIFPLGAYLIAPIAKTVPGWFGGRADWRKARIAVVWGAALCAPIILLGDAAAAIVIGSGGDAQMADLTRLAFGLAALYLFSSALGAAHQLRSGLKIYLATLAVLAAALGGLTILAGLFGNG